MSDQQWTYLLDFELELFIGHCLLDIEVKNSWPKFIGLLEIIMLIVKSMRVSI